MTVLLLAFLAALQQPEDATLQGLVIPVPAGWTRKDDPSGVVYLSPPADRNPFSLILCVLPPNRIPGSGWEAHKTMVASLLQQAQWTGGEPVTTHDPDGPGFFIKTGAAGRTAAGEGKEFTLFTALHDGVMEAVLAVNRLDRDQVDPILARTRFKDPPAPQARPKIAEAFRRLNQRMVTTRDGGALAAGSLLYDRIWLRADGVADFSTTYLEGYAASPLVFKVDAALQNGSFGSWKADGDKLQIVRLAGSSPDVCARANGGLNSGGKDWEPMPRVDGIKLSGRWALKSPPEEKTSPYNLWIEFTPEGRFKTEGLLRHVAANDFRNAKPPERGAGAYEARDWTMFFKFDDGTAWSTDFSTLGREITPETSILFRTVAVPKAK